MHVNIIMKYTERSLRDIFNYNTLITLHEKPNRMLSETKCMQGIYKTKRKKPQQVYRANNILLKNKTNFSI
jgi:hypothetical protein